MRRTIHLSLTVVLVAAVALLAGCKQPGNALGVNTDLELGTGAGNLPSVAATSPGNAAQLVDDDPATAGIQATVVVTFSDYMDESSVVGATTVENTTTGELVAGLELSYNADARRLYIRHADWTRNGAFLVVVKSGGAKNRWGAALDGNRNGTAEGTPYDDALSTFYTESSAPESCVATTAPHLLSITPDTVRITDTLPGLIVSFSGAMDSATLVAANFRLLSKSGSSIALDRAGFTPTTVTFTPRSPLRYGDRYDFTVLNSGLRATAPANTPEYLLVLDADGDGPEAQETDQNTYFLCDTIPPPTVDATEINGGMRFDFTRLMDETTLSAQNVRVYDGTGYVPGTMVYSRLAPGANTRVDCFFSRPVEGSFRVFVSREVEALDGRMLDGQESPNGIGGEPWDDFWAD